MTGTSSRSANASPARNILRTLWIIAAIYLALLIGQPAGLDPVKIVSDIRLTPALLLQQLLTGLADGAIIVIIALGYTLVYGIIELVNFAHGDVFMLGTYVALLSTSFFIIQVNNESRAPFWVALLAFIPAMLTMGGLNALIERVAYRRLRNQPKLASLISAIGMSFILQNIGLQVASFGKLSNLSPALAFLDVFGQNNATAKQFPTFLSDQNVLVYVFGPDVPIRMRAADILVIVVALVLMSALSWFVQNTRMGKAMRATAQNQQAAMIMGIDVNKVISFTFILGGALAGAAGVMNGIYNGSASFTMGFQAGLRSFTAAVLGGIGNIKGAALGGILIGLLAAISDTYLSSRWTNAWVFLILVLVLVFRPTGLLGQDGGEKA